MYSGRLRTTTRILRIAGWVSLPMNAAESTLGCKPTVARSVVIHLAVESPFHRSATGPICSPPVGGQSDLTRPARPVAERVTPPRATPRSRRRARPADRRNERCELPRWLDSGEVAGWATARPATPLSPGEQPREMSVAARAALVVGPRAHPRHLDWSTRPISMRFVACLRRYQQGTYPKCGNSERTQGSVSVSPSEYSMRPLFCRTA
jgi:hypothetical protein